MSQPTALIFGITSQDGSYLADLLLSKGHAVVGVLRRTTEMARTNIRHLAGRIGLEFADLSDFAAIEAIVAACHPDEIYSIAAQSVPADSWKRVLETGDITALGPVRILEAARRRAPGARIYQASSREVFGGIEQEVVSESTPMRANNPYGAAKLFAHHMVEIYRESYGMKVCGGILFNHESPRRGLHFVTRKISMAAAVIATGQDSPLDELGRPLVENRRVMLGNTDAMRDWGYAPEYVEAMWAMLQQTTPRDYVIATNTIHSVAEFAEAAFAAAGLHWRDHVVEDERLKRPTEITASRGDYALAQRELGWRPRTFMKELARLMVEADVALLTGSRSEGMRAR
jgi:GDPmannose 4,6-dehydratase